MPVIRRPLKDNQGQPATLASSEAKSAMRATPPPTAPIGASARLAPLAIQSETAEKAGLDHAAAYHSERAAEEEAGVQKQKPAIGFRPARTPTLLSAKSFAEMPMMAAYKSERTEGVGSSANRFFSPATADGTMSSPAGELNLETAEETPNAEAMATNAVAEPNSSSMAGMLTRCTAGRLLLAGR